MPQAPAQGSNATIPATSAVALTKSDTTVIGLTRALYIGTTGDVAVRMADGRSVTFKTVPVGVLPIQCDQLLSTGTTAAEVVALY